MKVLLDPNLSDKAARLHTFMMHRLHGRGRCWQTQEAIASDMGWSVSTVRRTLAELVEKKLLVVGVEATSSGRRNVYSFAQEDPYDAAWTDEVERRAWGDNRPPKEDLKTPSEGDEVKSDLIPPTGGGDEVKPDLMGDLKSDMIPPGMRSNLTSSSEKTEALSEAGKPVTTTDPSPNINSTTTTRENQNWGVADAARRTPPVEGVSETKTAGERAKQTAAEALRKRVKEDRGSAAKGALLGMEENPSAPLPRKSVGCAERRLGDAFNMLFHQKFPGAYVAASLTHKQRSQLKNVLTFCGGDEKKAVALAKHLIDYWDVLCARHLLCRNAKFPAIWMLDSMKETLAADVLGSSVEAFDFTSPNNWGVRTAEQMLEELRRSRQ